MKSIFYWSPFTSKVATIKSVINSAYGVNKYLNNTYTSYILDAVDEWSSYSKEITNKNLKVIKLNNKSIFNLYNKEGYLRSRIAYLYIFFKSIIPLNKLLKDKKPSFLIVHLITSLPLFLYIFNKYETKLILRISGLPKMNFLRKILWKLAIRRIHKITCPTEDTYKDLSKYEFLKHKLIVLRDPVINIFDIQKTKKKGGDNFYDKKINLMNKNFILSIGRFTKQKNFIFYLKCIPKILKLKKDLYFVFIGQGENEKFFLKMAKELKILDKILLIKNTENVHHYMKKSSCFVSTSLWEDPGFVLIEAGYNNCQVISSDCPNGPKEIIGLDGGYLFNSNNKDSFVQVFEKFLNDTPKTKYLKKIALKKRVKKFTLYQHVKLLPKILGCS
jgi:glycosyltransferase involved in cell wall biosynthesis